MSDQCSKNINIQHFLMILLKYNIQYYNNAGLRRLVKITNNENISQNIIKISCKIDETVYFPKSLIA